MEQRKRELQKERQKSGEVFLKQLHFQNEDVPCLSAPEHVSLCNYSQAILLLYQPKDSHQTRTHPRPVSHKQFSSLSELMENAIYKKESTSCIQDISKWHLPKMLQHPTRAAAWTPEPPRDWRCSRQQGLTAPPPIPPAAGLTQVLVLSPSTGSHISTQLSSVFSQEYLRHGLSWLSAAQ